MRRRESPHGSVLIIEVDRDAASKYAAEVDVPGALEVVTGVVESLLVVVLFEGEAFAGPQCFA